MEAFLKLSHDERRLLCEEARATLGLAAASIEKDFWVCWTLRELFALQGWGPHLTFKGGTSLSKGWKLIERFSEDIDIVIDREFLGFPGERLSNKQINKLKDACSKRIVTDLLPTLRKHLAERLPEGEDWKLVAASAEDAPDMQTLFFRYPTEFTDPAGYVKPVVKIELGARSETEPAESPNMQPMLAEAYPNVLGAASFSVRTVAPRRTFWEKAMLLHEETYRPAGKARMSRMSRHYYDLWCLITKGVAAEAVRDEGLFERVAAHRQIFFRHRWMDYATLSKGRLRLLPLPEQEAAWRQDYEAMRGEMFYGAPPSFATVLQTVTEFESEFNRP